MENELIHIVLENFQKTTGLLGIWKEGNELDGTLELTMKDVKIKCIAELKNEVRPHQLLQIEQNFMKYENYILIANRLFPKIKEEMRMKEIPYLESNGNVYLNKKYIFLFVETKNTLAIGKETGNRAFTKTGLKVLFHLLQYKDHINLTHREIAEKAGVALGNIPQVIDGLKETGFLIPLNNKQFIWENRKELLERWITEYGTNLKPKIIKDHYTLQGRWQQIQLNNQTTVWGGEPAADILTNYLRPEKFVLYTKESRADLMKNYRLIPAKDGEIEVLNMFWVHDEKANTAPPVLIYADLLLEGGKRNTETAEKIFNEYIKPKL